MNNLNYYKTPSFVAKELFRHIDMSGVKTIIDVGAGEGALLKGHGDNGYYKKIAIEVNQHNMQDLTPIYDEVYRGDVFKGKISQMNGNSTVKALFISNPPFGVTPYTKKLRKLMTESGFYRKESTESTCRMELVFIARVLEAAKAGDQSGFIVPASIVSQHRFKRVREELVINHGLHACTFIPDNIFKDTEVRTAIIWFKPFSGSAAEHVRVYEQFNSKPVSIPVTEFIEANTQDLGFNSSDQDTLGEIIVNMKRGVSSKRSLLDRGIRHIHTSDLNQKHASVVRTPLCTQNPGDNVKERYAKDGDILMARVGTRVVGKAAIFSGAKAVISDCVIRIRVADRDRNDIFKKLVSANGQQWLRKASTGSCARLLSYRVLNKFPLANEL